MNRIYPWILILGLVFWLGMIMINCTKPEDETDIKIGIISILTGDAALYGERAKRGVELALEEINKESIRGKQIKIIYEDSQADPKKAVSAFQKLVELDKVKFILGPLTSSEVLAIAPLAEKKKVIVLSPTATAPEITHAGDYVFRNATSDLFEGAALAEFVVEELQKRKAAIIYINNDFGIGLKESFKKRFSSIGGETLAEEAFERKDMDFRAQLSRINKTNSEILFLIGQAEMGQVLKQTFELGIKMQIVSYSGFEDPAILDVAKKAAEGVYYTFQGFGIASEGVVVENFRKKYVEKFNEEPDNFSALSYDALKIYAEAFKKSGFTTEDVKKALYEIKNFIGVVGITSFDENGDVTKPIGIKTVKNGKFVWVNKRFEFALRDTQN